MFILFSLQHPAVPQTEDDPQSTAAAQTKDDPQLKTALSKSNGKYRWNKQHACKFCPKLVNKMSTHLIDVHSDISEVAEVLALPIGSKKRRREFIKIQDEGDYIHNTEIIKKGHGTVIPKYRKTQSTEVDNLIACLHCHGLYTKNVLHIHYKTCYQKPEDFKALKKGEAVKMGRLIMPSHITDKAFDEHVIQRMRDDQIKKIIKRDPLILEFGQRKFSKRDIEEHTPGNVSTKMRELGRLLEVYRKVSNNPSSTMNDMITGKNFDKVVLAVKELAGFEASTHKFEKGTLATHLGHSLRKCSHIKKATASKELGKCELEADKEFWSEQNKEAKLFDNAFKGDWHDKVSATAYQSVSNSKRNKPKLLPLCRDVTKIHTLLDKKMESEEYQTITQATLCAISLFNRKRGGEVQRMKISELQAARVGKTENEDILRDLTETEKKMIDCFQRVEIRGKLNRTVPIILTKKMLKALDKIMLMRKTFALLDDNPYVFATPTGMRPYRGSDVLREVAMEAGVSDEFTDLTFTGLRKQVATLSQSLAISDLEQDQLATFLGHDIRVHRHIYRLPQEILQKAKVAKILMEVNQGLDVHSHIIDDDLHNAEVNFDDEDEDVVPQDMLSEQPSVQKQRKRKNPVPLHDEEQNDECTEQSSVKNQRKRKRPIPLHDEENDDMHIEPLKKRRLLKRQGWTEEEKASIQRRFRANFVTQKIPGKNDCQEAILDEPALRQRRWESVRQFVRNAIDKQKNTHTHKKGTSSAK